ncbi:hypothetical protein LVJ83_04945 [Uruburuella testudinis]|uniref:Uncharacterized protein n=1 Tax=Uruburuella testudinis TaxID=1282863 RepID=A0ABY4DVX8_9NEIS|nr:hypothetical protein [Uruburuella testudinis]UOO82815.1 hypothetical protein LVJ83_04945 [Uruburuella testudinis]
MVGGIFAIEADGDGFGSNFRTCTRSGTCAEIAAVARGYNACQQGMA